MNTSTHECNWTTIAHICVTDGDRLGGLPIVGDCYILPVLYRHVCFCTIVVVWVCFVVVIVFFKRFFERFCCRLGGGKIRGRQGAVQRRVGGVVVRGFMRGVVVRGVTITIRSRWVVMLGCTIIVEWERRREITDLVGDWLLLLLLEATGRIRGSLAGVLCVVVVSFLERGIGIIRHFLLYKDVKSALVRGKERQNW